MKILIIANSQIVFGRELKTELKKYDHEVSLLDFSSLVLQDSNGNENINYSTSFNRYKNIPKLSMLYRMFYIKKILDENSFEIVNIHFSRWFYLLILPILSKQKYIITFYGSDFYRTSHMVKNIQKPLYKKAYKITFTNPLTKQSFLNYYNHFEDKSYVCRFGLKTLEYIDKNRDKDISLIKKALGYSLDKVIITCGYNSTKAQRHEKIIENILKLPKEAVDQIQFVFPMTYGDNLNKEKIKAILNKTTLDYIVLEDFLYGDDNAYIKLVSDIMINILQTDSFSGSMQEFLYGSNVVITGSWLPYEVFDNEGIEYKKIDNTDQLSDKIIEVLHNIEKDKEKLGKNMEIIYRLSSWNYNIKNWIKVYEN